MRNANCSAQVIAIGRSEHESTSEHQSRNRHVADTGRAGKVAADGGDSNGGLAASFPKKSADRACRQRVVARWRNQPVADGKTTGVDDRAAAWHGPSHGWTGTRHDCRQCLGAKPSRFGEHEDSRCADRSRMAERTPAKRYIDPVAGPFSGSEDSEIQIARRNSRAAGASWRSAQSGNRHVLRRRHACELDVLGGPFRWCTRSCLCRIVAGLERQPREPDREVMAVIPTTIKTVTNVGFSANGSLSPRAIRAISSTF